ncbi:Membrane protein [Geobacillus stearothermophilus]|nr:Membrane protein [Geobacillus stearothermophilus]
MNHNVNTMFGEEKRNMVLIGVLIVIIGFIVRINPLLVVTAAGLATGLLAHQSLYDINEQFGTAFTINRYMAVFIATLPVIGLLERFGLREQAESVVAKIKAATTGRILMVYLTGKRQPRLGLLPSAAMLKWFVRSSLLWQKERRICVQVPTALILLAFNIAAMYVITLIIYKFHHQKGMEMR